MFTKRLLKKAFSVLTVCCLLSGMHLSRACALEQQQSLMCPASDTPLFQERAGHLLSHTSGMVPLPVSEEDRTTISVAQFDIFGSLVIYNIIMFIYFGRQCLETLDPDPCGAMVNHLVLALFLGILLEGF